MDRRIPRRHLLRLGGLATAGTVAGCLGDSGGEGGEADDGGDDGEADGGQAADGGDGGDGNGNDSASGVKSQEVIPDFADSLIADESGIGAMYLDRGLIETIAAETASDETVFDTMESTLVLQMISDGLRTLDFTLSLSSFLVHSGIENLKNVTQDHDLDTSIDEILVNNDTLVLSGAVDTDELDDRLTDSDEDSGLKYGRTDGVGQFGVYEPVESVEGTVGDPTPIATSEDVVCSARDRSRLDALLDRLRGERPAVTDEFDGYEWILSEADPAEFVLTQYTDPDRAPAGDGEGTGTDEGAVGGGGGMGLADALSGEDVHGFALTASVPDVETVDMSIAARFDELGETARAELQILFEIAAASGSLDVESDHVVGTARFTEARLQEFEDA